MRDVADAVHIGVLRLRGALASGEVLEIGHESLDEALEERHHDDDPGPGEAADEFADAVQMSRDGEGIAVGRNRPRGHGEPSQHPGMVVADLFQEVAADDRVRLRRRDGEIGGGHPVDEIPFEHCGVARDDPAAFLGRELYRVRARRDQVLDRTFDTLLDRRGARWLGRHVTHLSFPWSLVSVRNCRGPTVQPVEL